MDESGERHPQQTDTRTENETPHILTHRQVMNNENTWTQGGEHYTLGSIGGNRGGTMWGGGSWVGIAWGEMPDEGEGEEDSKSHCHVCTYARVLSTWQYGLLPSSPSPISGMSPHVILPQLPTPCCPSPSINYLFISSFSISDHFLLLLINHIS